MRQKKRNFCTEVRTLRIRPSGNIAAVRCTNDVPLTPQQYADNIARSLDVQDQSVRLKAALAAGTHPHPSLLEPLVRRLGVEPDFFVRENLSWALVRQPKADVLPLLERELQSKNILARTQAVHTLSKIGDHRAWPWITPALLHDADDDLARTSWRAAAAVVPDAEKHTLASELAKEFGRGDDGVKMALTMAILSLGDAAIEPINAAMKSPNTPAAEHARATELLRTRDDLTFGPALEEARRIIALGGA